MVPFFYTLPLRAAEPDKSVFTLGEITVTAKKENDISPLDPDTLSREDLRNFERDSLPDALNLIPGVTMTAGSGTRNETTVSVRGYDRWRVPLLLDGIRLYLPADNRIDFDRFLTPDLSEIQVAKGYVTVINGTDGMGGAINLVTRKPQKPFEADLLFKGAFSNDGHYNGNTLFANLGTRQEKYYLQAGVEQRDSRGFYLSDKFEPTAYEDGGKREHTDKKDWRVNIKTGYTPNATDEYSLNFIKQEGEKRMASSVNSPEPATVWDWPEWNVWVLYWLSHTAIGDKSYIKTKAYYEKFDNLLTSSNKTNLSNRNQNFDSYYDDSALGASAELGTELWEKHTQKAALHWRRDNHHEWNEYPSTVATNGVFGAKEPKQNTLENTVSLALEETWHVHPEVDLVLGVSRDGRFTEKAEEYGQKTTGGAYESFDYETAHRWATNLQTAALWRYRETGSTHVSVSRRTRFPTLFERYSSRFGGATSNPNLKPERGLNFEWGIKDKITPWLAGEASLYYYKVDDAIESVLLVAPNPYAGQSQSRNVGQATYKGIELGITLTPVDQLIIGANYTYIDTVVKHYNSPDSRLDSTPRSKGFLYAKWTPIPKLSVIPALEVSGKRPGNNTTTAGKGAYELLSLRLAYEIAKDLEISLTGRNLLDKNYEVATGYPQEGRNYSLSLRFKY
ncbi:MAG: TonB-dependent receptor [Burkholderiales bacterium]|nr:TonB-dependent receptor [Burkholderiales bacterium]